MSRTSERASQCPVRSLMTAPVSCSSLQCHIGRMIDAPLSDWHTSAQTLTFTLCAIWSRARLTRRSCSDTRCSRASGALVCIACDCNVHYVNTSNGSGHCIQERKRRAKSQCDHFTFGSAAWAQRAQQPRANKNEGTASLRWLARVCLASTRTELTLVAGARKL